jgi:two-component system, OmpR family, osmolarity sensor histidine kinase EnvZ
MVALTDDTITELAEHPTLRRRFSRFLERHLPEGLYPRSLIIVVTPMVLLQSFVAFTFMERHWDTVTKRLSRATTQDIAMLIDVYETYPQDKDHQQLVRMANDRLDISLSITKGESLPAPKPKPLFSLLDTTLSKEITKRIGRPFWIDTVGQSNYVDIRIKVDEAIFRIITRRSRTYASNSEIFLLWMIGTSFVLLTVAIVFLRNQIRPIQQLAEAAQSFGMGRDVPDFRPRGAIEVQRASLAFLQMRERIERHVEQRTAMLAGVSHDLRTMLTRFKLQLAMLGDDPQVKELQNDVNEMQHMLEDYVAFVRGDGGEVSVETDVGAMLEDIRCRAATQDFPVSLDAPPNLVVPVKPNAFKRCVSNLVSNAARFATRVDIRVARDDKYLRISVDDDGPGIPEDMRDDVFRPFFRLDDARNQDTGGTGLGLAIARDIARSHGGDIRLGDSPLGGLRATVRVPV